MFALTLRGIVKTTKIGCYPVPAYVCATKLFLSTSSSLRSTSDRSVFPENDPGMYKRARKALNAELERRLNNPNRFQSINDREERSDVPLDAFKINSKGRYIVTYKGCNIVCSPEDYVLYHQLFWYIKPKTVIEVGTCEGGKAIWFGDQLKLLNIPGGHVYTMELDPSLFETAKKLNPDNVTFLQGDSNEIENTFTPDMLLKLPHPWVIVEDSHVNLSGILGYFHRFFKEGDYFVVEDINPYLPVEIGATIITPSDPCPLAGTAKLDEFKDFFRKHDDYYAVDSFFSDFYGYNSSWMWHGFVRRMKN